MLVALLNIYKFLLDIASIFHLILSFPPLGQGCFKHSPAGPLPLTNGLLFNLTPFLFYAFSSTICYVKLPITDRDSIQHLLQFASSSLYESASWLEMCARMQLHWGTAPVGQIATNIRFFLLNFLIHFHVRSPATKMLFHK